MKPIPLNMMTLYADLLQTRAMLDVVPGSISTKTVGKKKYIYAVEKHGRKRVQRFLGPADDDQANELAETYRQAELVAKGLRSTVSALKQARVPAPSLVLGRVLEVVANAGLFDQGITLVGTAAYQTYAPLLGYYMPASALMTNDVDLSVAEFIEADEQQQDLEKILKRADESFAPRMRNEDKLPVVFKASNGFSVDILTRYGRGRRSPVQVPSLKCAAEALSFQEYLTEQTIEAVALYGHGVLVRVPPPERFAVHKLLLAQRRARTQVAKKRKDLAQARELLDIFLEVDKDLLQDTLDEARDRGKTWKSNINASLKELKRESRQGHLPIPVTQKRAAKRRTAPKRKVAT